MHNHLDPALVYTSPENRGRCGFCGKTEGGYAKQDSNKKWQPACWNCVKPVPQEPQKRKHVGTVIHEDLDADEIVNQPGVKTKAPGMAPSAHRPKVI